MKLNSFAIIKFVFLPIVIILILVGLSLITTIAGIYNNKKGDLLIVWLFHWILSTTFTLLIPLSTITYKIINQMVGYNNCINSKNRQPYRKHTKNNYRHAWNNE